MTDHQDIEMPVKVREGEVFGRRTVQGNAILKALDKNNKGVLTKNDITNYLTKSAAKKQLMKYGLIVMISIVVLQTISTFGVVMWGNNMSRQLYANSSGITDANGNMLQTAVATSTPVTLDFAEGSFDAIISLETALSWVCPQVDRIKLESESVIIESNVLIDYIDADCTAGTVNGFSMQMLDDGSSLNTSISCEGGSCNWSWIDEPIEEEVDGAERRRLATTISGLNGLKNIMTGYEYGLLGGGRTTLGGGANTAISQNVEYNAGNTISDATAKLLTNYTNYYAIKAMQGARSCGDATVDIAEALNVWQNMGVNSKDAQGRLYKSLNLAATAHAYSEPCVGSSSVTRNLYQINRVGGMIAGIIGPDILEAAAAANDTMVDAGHPQGTVVTWSGMKGVVISQQTQAGVVVVYLYPRHKNDCKTHPTPAARRAWYDWALDLSDCRNVGSVNCLRAVPAGSGNLTASMRCATGTSYLCADDTRQGDNIDWKHRHDDWSMDTSSIDTLWASQDDPEYEGRAYVASDAGKATGEALTGLECARSMLVYPGEMVCCNA